MGLMTSLADLAFPRSCAGCGAWDTALCPDCARLMGPQPPAWHDVVGRAPYLNTVRIVRDGLNMPGDPVPYFSVWSLGDYAGRRRAAIVSWKNSIDRELTAKMRAIARRAGAALAAMPAFAAAGPLALVPAPSRWSRRHDGRFVAGHLAAALAAGLEGEGIDCRTRDVLRTRRAGGKGSLAGRGAKADAIRLARRATIAGSCLLVDDVLTTGATLAGCARTLEAAGARVVGAAVLAAAADPRQAVDESGSGAKAADA